MKSFQFLIMIVGLILQMGCQLRDRTSTQQSPNFTEKDIIGIANREIQRRDIDPKYGLYEINKVQTRIIVMVSLSDDSLTIAADENGGVIEIKGKNLDKYSFLKNTSSKILENAKDAESYFSGQFSKYLPNNKVNELSCYYYPKGWWVQYKEKGFIGQGAGFTVIVRENGVVDQILPMK